MVRVNRVRIMSASEPEETIEFPTGSITVNTIKELVEIRGIRKFFVEDAYGNRLGVHDFPRDGEVVVREHAVIFSLERAKKRAKKAAKRR